MHPISPLVSRHFPVLIVIAVVTAATLALYFSPLWINRGDLPPHESQHKCQHERWLKLGEKGYPTDPNEVMRVATIRSKQEEGERLNIIRLKQDPRKVARPTEKIKIIRLTNAGEFVDRCEFTDALYELNWDRKFPTDYRRPTPIAESKPKLVLLYVHGWKHNAEDGNENLRDFGELVTQLQTEDPDKRVVGIYVGWNGSAGLWSWLENLTFWVKKTNADRIAQSNSVTLITSAIGSIVRADPARKDQFIEIGHSFGARILYSATAQSIIAMTALAHPGHPKGSYKIVQSPIDAVILLNPAFEAARYSAIDDITRADEHFADLQPPLMITISSDGDTDTQTYFPIGLWLEHARASRELSTLGNHLPYITHTFRPSRDDPCTHAASKKLSEEFAAESFCLRRMSNRRVEYPASSENPPPVQKNNPFIVTRAPTSFIENHSGIWKLVVRKWLAAFIKRLQAEIALSRT
jgi:hypothetical protein